MSSSRPDAAENDVALHDRAESGEAPATRLPPGRRQALFVIAVVVGAVAVWQLATIRPGHQWGDDFAMYIMEARNIASLHSYTDTGFIYNPARPTYAPRAYPPGYPLVLAPVYRMFGLSFTPMKVEIILMFVGALFLLGLLVLDELPLPYVALLLALIGFAPKFTQFKNNVLSDIPGMFFVVLVLL